MHVPHPNWVVPPLPGSSTGTGTAGKMARLPFAAADATDEIAVL
jgi:hypothetical protein